MQTPTEIPSPRLVCGCLLSFLIAAIVISGCGSKGTPMPMPTAPAPSTPTAPPTAKSTAPRTGDVQTGSTATLTATSSARLTATPATRPTIAPTVLPTSVFDRVIPLPSGGYILVPEGALPREAQVTVGPACTPLLLQSVEAVGEAFAVQATDQPSQPVFFHLPIPSGVDDPSELVIIRVEPNGRTTFLVTEVEANELIAASPGFSTFVVAKNSPTAPAMIGKALLLPGEREVYSFDSDSPEWLQDTSWNVTDGLALVHGSEHTALVQAFDQTGWETLGYEFIYLVRGVRWFGGKRLYISQDPMTLEDPSFSLDVITQTPLVYDGSEVLITAKVLGRPETPITWIWDYGDGEIGGPVTTGEQMFDFDLPPKRYTSPNLPVEYEATVTATDGRGRKVQGAQSVRVVVKPRYGLEFEGPQSISWTTQEVVGTYTARASGAEPPYWYFWMLTPGYNWPDEYGATSTQSFQFYEPGDYRMTVLANEILNDQKRLVTYRVQPILVTPGKPLGTQILGLPATAMTGERVVADTSASDGVLIVAGEKRGYRLEIDWGDGSVPQVQEDVGRTRRSPEGASLAVRHTYFQPGLYTVRVRACDATGSLATAAREITVSGPAIAVTPTPTSTRTPTGSPTATRTRTVTPTWTPTGSPTVTRTRTVTPTWTPTGSPTVTRTRTVTPSRTPTVTRTRTVTPTRTVTRTPTPTTVTPYPPAGGRARWVLVDTLINASGEPLEYYGGGRTPGYFGEARFEGKFEIYTLSETSIAGAFRDVDHGIEYFNVKIQSAFDAPDKVLYPGETHKLAVRFSSSGTVIAGSPGQRFQYGADRAHGGIIQPAEVLTYYPWDPGFTGLFSKSYTLTVPQGRPGDTFQVWAGWWNCGMCNVTWTYRME